MDTTDLAAVGTRISLAGSHGTIKFAGHVDNTKGIWLGVEWDDPDRGKHSGMKDDKQYFECRIPNAGSFIRPSVSICYGISFLHALRSKYIEIQHGSASEKVTLGSSNGAIEVAAVGLDKIREKFANLDRLREVSVDSENVATVDPPGEIRSVCPNIRGLDLSSNLLPSWDVVALIATELPLLERLALNRNRFALVKDVWTASSAFCNLTELQLNGTLMAWSELEQIALIIPKLRVVEMGYNRIAHLSPSSTPVQSNLLVVNLDGNELQDWALICGKFKSYSTVERLILTSNRIGAVPSASGDSAVLQNIKHLALSFNKIQVWSDIHALSQWCPRLETLSLSGNPLLEDLHFGRYARQFVVGSISTLIALDATPISPRERADCEIFYLAHIAKSGLASDEEKRREHPRWEELCAKHGRPEDVAKPRLDKLSNQLIQINLYPCAKRVPSTPRIEAKAVGTAPVIPLRILPTMSLRTFRLKVFKSLKPTKWNANQVSVELWLKMRDETFTEMSRDHDEQELGWWGLENGSDVYVYLHPKE